MDICKLLNEEQGYNLKDIKIKVYCSVCGKELITIPSTYRKQKTFKCEDHIFHRGKGDKSVLYNRLETSCSFCGKKMMVPPSHFKRTNKDGEFHVFCQRKCYNEFRKIYYVGEKHPMTNHIYTKEQMDNIIKGIAKGHKGRGHTNTKIQIKANNLLEKMEIDYNREYVIQYYSCDLYLPKHNLIIEVMGDYWHGNPLKYNSQKYDMNDIQAKTILKDKQKKSYISSHTGISILYLWESDINKDIKKCEMLVSKFIQTGGKLFNYHSFNWDVCENRLCHKTKGDLIVPYQDMPSSEYKHLLTRHCKSVQTNRP